MFACLYAALEKENYSIDFHRIHQKHTSKDALRQTMIKVVSEAAGRPLAEEEQGRTQIQG